MIPNSDTMVPNGGPSSGGGASGANPTATAGPVAINGTATTFMRSDAAPAIQKASASQFGIVEVDGTTITAAAGVISATGSGAPGGAVNDIQFNNGSGGFGGDGGLVYNGSGSITLTDGSNFITCSPNSGASPLIEVFYAAHLDAKVTIGLAPDGATQAVLLNSPLSVSGSIFATGTFFVAATIGSVASGASPSNSAAGILELWSVSGASPFITWSEKSVANRGAFGFKHGDSKLYYYSGTETIDSGGTLGFTCDATGNFSAATVAHVATTIAGLPSPVAGMVAYVTDGDAGLGWGATAVNSGTGGNKYLVWYNGTNWTVAGK